MTTIREGALVQFAQATGIVPQGITGTVVRVSKGTFLVKWNYPDPSRKGELLNWHRARSLKLLEVHTNTRAEDIALSKQLFG